MDEVVNKLKLSFIMDLQKPEINKFERALIIRDYLDSHKLSIRGFSKKFGFNKSTVEDWLLWEKVSEEDYEEKIDSGYTHSDIYRQLRNSNGVGRISINERLKRDIVRYNLLVKSKDKTDKETKDLVEEFKSVLDKILLT